MWTLVGAAKKREKGIGGGDGVCTNTSVAAECNDFCRCDSPKQFGDELISASALLYATLFSAFFCTRVCVGLLK